jgi:hypothetical protein
LRAAREHGYHSDYIGQLIRGGKVKGQKVGRAWYVDADSLALYLGKEGVSEPQEIVVEEKSQPEEIPVVPIIENRESNKPIQNSEEKVLISKQEEMVSDEVPVAKDPEEHRIEIVKIHEAPEPSIKVKIISAKRSEEDSRSGGLVYVHDDEPLLPEIRKGSRISRPYDEEKIVPVTTRAVPSLAVHEFSQPSKNFFLRWVVLLVFAAMVLISAATLSSSLVRNLSVGSHEAAGVQFSFPY